MPRSNAITPRQQQVLGWVRAFITTHGYAPTVREISRAHGFNSTNAASDHLQALQRKGYLTVDGTKARSIVLTEPGRKESAPLDPLGPLKQALRKAAEIEEWTTVIELAQVLWKTRSAPREGIAHHLPGFTWTPKSTSGSSYLRNAWGIGLATVTGFGETDSDRAAWCVSGEDGERRSGIALTFAEAKRCAERAIIRAGLHKPAEPAISEGHGP